MSDRARKAYDGAVTVLRGALRGGVTRIRRSSAQLREAAAALAGAGEEDDQGLLRAAMMSTAECPLYGHGVNTACYTLAVTAGLGVRPAVRTELAAHALTLDAVLAAGRGVEWLPGMPLEALDRDVHPDVDEGVYDFLAKIAALLPEDLGQLVPVPTSEVPGISRPVHQGAQILALCDLLEGWSHPRPWRRALPPGKVLLPLVRRFRREGDQPVVRSLLKAITLYPPGTLVRLSTGELAEITRTRADSPNRPLVAVLARVDGTRIEPPMPLDLPMDGQVNVMEHAECDAQTVTDGLLRARLTLARWWSQAPRNPPSSDS
ncbi:MAG: hypothetical protein HYZ75_14870 [Elusimicrobia bacterium]|nr:hypothetical protein [Elusimicrobiota bacterium]